MAGEPRKPTIRGRRIIERPRLIRVLDRSDARVRMLVAGPGYGKTTLTEQWAPDDGRVLGWYRARRSAADVAVAARGLVTAADGVLPGAGRRLLERLAVTEDPEREVTLLAEMLAEDLCGWPAHGWIVIDDYQLLAASEASEAFVETIVEHSPVQLLVAGRVRPSWVQPLSILDGHVLEVPEGALAMTSDEVEEVLEGGRTELASGLVALAGGWPAVVGLAGMAPQAREVDAVLPETLYEFFAEQIYDGLEPRLRKDLDLLATMPLVDRELVVTLIGPERARRTVDEALALGILDERGERLELHPLVESFFRKRARAETRAEAVQAFPTAWAYYTARKEPDAAFDLAHELGVPSDVDRLLIESMDELLNSARLSTLETWVGRAVRLVGETPAVLVAQAEIALRRGRHLTAQALADRAVRADEVARNVRYRALLAGGRAAHIGQREEAALSLYSQAEMASSSDAQSRAARWGRLSVAAALELEAVAVNLLEELQVPPTGDFDLTEAVRTADKRLVLGIRFGAVRGLDDARSVEELLPLVPDPFVRCSFRGTFSCALNLTSEYSRALQAATSMIEDATEFRVEFALPYGSLMQATALVGLRRFDEAHECLDNAFVQAVRCTDRFGQESVYASRVRALLHEGRVVEACGLEPPDPSNSLPGMRGEIWASRGLALACIGRLDEARRLADAGSQATSAIEASILARCIRAIAALKSRDSDLTEEVRALMSAAWDAGAVDYVVTSYRASPELLAALLRDPSTAERTGYVVARASDYDLAASIGIDATAVFDPVSTLSARERDVYALLCEGMPNREIATRLFISHETVKVHVRHVYDKLGIRSRTALALQAASRRPSSRADGDLG
jgi:LuxR family transcriptional regulator, maltose regulon positive regulatory protein